jgi:hypothetical protein
MCKDDRGIVCESCTERPKKWAIRVPRQISPRGQIIRLWRSSRTRMGQQDYFCHSILVRIYDYDWERLKRLSGQKMREMGQCYVGRGPTNISISRCLFQTPHRRDHQIQLLRNGQFLWSGKRRPTFLYSDAIDTLHVDEPLAPILAPAIYYWHAH